MNQKKCPKCGEMNPGEAVMCWACYTPLAGGAGGAVAGADGAGGTAAMSTPTIISDEGEKKPVEKWQIALIGVALLLGVGFGVRSMIGGETGGDDGTGTADNMGTITTTVVDPGNGGAPVAPPSPGTTTTVPNPGMGGGGPVAPEPAPYTVVSPANPQSDWGVLGIVPTVPNITPQRAASLAAAAYKQFKNNGWKAMHIYVFADNQAGQVFSDFQLPRRSAALGAGDYGQLTQLWPRCLVRYEVNGPRARVHYPSKQPNSWWSRS